MSKPVVGDNPAAAVLDIVGRDTEINRIQRVFEQRSSRPQVIFITGDGGVGKTRLLVEALPSETANLIVDFYHMQVHATDSFIEALYDTLPVVDDFFREYEEKAAYAQRTQNTQERDRLLAEARQDFITGLRRLSQKEPVVLRLDTLERLVYDLGKTGRTRIDRPHAWRWLVEVLPHLGQVTLLMAGRRRAENLLSELEAVNDIDLIKIELKPLNEADSWHYLERAADYCRKHNQPHIANVIQDKLLRDEGIFRPLVFNYTGGRPIFLALMVDYLSLAPDKDIQVLIETLQSGADIEFWEKQLIGRLMSEVTDGDIIRFLGYLPKGANADLLAEVTGLPAKEIELKLAAARQFSFVKPAADGRIFLHDEMYQLFARRHLLVEPGEGPEAEQVQEGISRYYEAQLEALSETIKDFYEVIEGGQEVDLQEPLAELNTLHQRLLTDDVYYRMRHDLIKGLRRWYRYVHEAALSANQALDTQLELEMVAFLPEFEKDERPEDADLKRIIESTLALSPIRRAWAMEDYLRVLDLANELRQHSADLFGEDPVLTAPLNTWEALSMSVRGNVDDTSQALIMLNRTIDALQDFEAMSAPDDDLYIWLAQMYLGFAYRARGYVRRVQGLMEEALISYQKALTLSNEVNVRIEVAYTENDMGFALAEVGRYVEAVDSITSALEGRYSLGIGVYIGLSLNTLAMVYVRQGEYDEAIKYSQRALYMFRALDYRRGEGLALNALAEAMRRKSSSFTANTRVSLLEQALKHANEARAIFEALGEVSRQVESLIEIGCAHRDMVQLCMDNPRLRLRGSLDEHVQESTDALTLAADLAGERDILYRHVDALVNLAWLNYFQSKLDDIELYADHVKTDTEDYWLNPQTGKPTIRLDDRGVRRTVWPQLAKLHVVRGHGLLRCCYDPAQRLEEREPVLRQVAEMYTLAINYDILFGQNHPGMQRARADIQSQLEQLQTDPEAIRIIKAAVLETESKYHLEPYASQFIQELKL